MFNLTKKRTVIFIILLLAIIATALYLRNDREKIDRIETVSCDKHFDDFYKLHKRIALSRVLSDTADDALIFSDAYSAWLKFQDSRPEDACLLFKDGRNDDLSIHLLGENLRLAREAVLENNFEEVFVYWDKADFELRNLKKSAQQAAFENEMRELYPDLISFKQSKDKEAGKEALEEIKQSFANLKRHGFDKNYHDLLLGMEKEIAKLDKYFDGPDYRQAKSRLEEIFLEIYYQY